MRMLKHYVEDNCRNDIAVLLSSLYVAEKNKSRANLFIVSSIFMGP
jgi:hypothetical protein